MYKIGSKICNKHVKKKKKWENDIYVVRIIIYSYPYYIHYR